MALIDITSANSALVLKFDTLFSSGFNVDDYAADNMFETAALQNAEDVMSADGKYHAGFVFNPAEFTINLMPTSQAGEYLDQVYAYERTAIGKLAVNATLIVPALDNAKWNFVNGILYNWTPAPPGRRILEARPAVFRFESITRS